MSVCLGLTPSNVIRLIGYKMREHLGKALKRRCHAVQNAVMDYNAAALACTPPRPTVDWDRVSHYQFLEDFALLRESRPEVLGQPWARPAVQVTMKQAMRIERAKEEIIRCNVEIRRLITHLADEDAHLTQVHDQLVAAKDPLAPILADFATRRKRVNAQVRARLLQTSRLSGFTGNITHGTRKGMPREDDVRMAPGEEAGTEEGEDSEEAEVDLDDRAGTPDLDEDDEVGEQAGTFVDYVVDLSAISY